MTSPCLTRDAKVYRRAGGQSVPALASPCPTPVHHLFFLSSGCELPFLPTHRYLTMTTPLLSITSDYASLLSPHHTPLGLYVLPSPTDPFTWSGTLFLHRGLYASLVLHFSLLFPADYPASAPKVVLSGPPSPYPFHPLVDPQTGEVGLSETSEFGQEGNRAMMVLHRFKDAFKKDALERVLERDVRDQGAFRSVQSHMQAREQTAKDDSVRESSSSPIPFADDTTSHLAPSTTTRMYTADPATFSDLARQSAKLSMTYGGEPNCPSSGEETNSS